MGSAAQTRDLFILNGKLVVISDFFIGTDVPFGVDDDLLLVAHSDDLGIAVGLQEKINTQLVKEEMWL